MNSKVTFFNSQITETLKCFEEKIKLIKSKHKDYLDELGIDLEKCVVTTFSENSINYSLEEELNAPVIKEIDEALTECFSIYSTKAK